MLMIRMLMTVGAGVGSTGSGRGWWTRQSRWMSRHRAVVLATDCSAMLSRTQFGLRHGGCFLGLPEGSLQ